ncbi:MAG: chromosome segregation protein SMC [Dehalococcoidia bacterium]
MYLKKLSLQGFKSFPNRTLFEFGPGITAVVGPNGSGKSNVADAIRWVLGEQTIRLLRAKKQEDVIFAGGKDRAPVGMAEAILTLDNEDKWLPVDFAEVELGRRVYRNGDSEYLLNGSRVRLKDLQELLARGDVGQNSYTIMGQGLVDQVLSMGSQERRAFLDEAADVKRFRVRIQEAHDRLGATRDNMERVQLIIAELEPRLAQLRRQADRAGEHARLAARLVELLREYYTYAWHEAQNNVVRARASLDQRRAEAEAAEERLVQVREQLHALGEEIRKRREAIARQDTRQGELEDRIRSLEQAIALDRERHAMVTARHEEVRLEIDALESEKVSLSTTDIDEGRRGIEIVQEVDAARASLAQSRDALDMAEREYAAKRSELQDLRQAADTDEGRLEELREAAGRAERRLAELAREREQSSARRKQLLVELIGYGRRYAELSVRAGSGEQRLEEARLAAEEARERLQRVQQELRQYEDAANADLRKQDHLEGRLEALRRVQAEQEGIARGTRALLVMGQALIEDIEPGSLGEPAEIPGVVGLLARQIRVPAGLETAINAALELRLHAVIIERDADARQALDLLRRRQEGRAQVIPLDVIGHTYPLNLQKERGVVGVASKLVKCDNRFRPLVDTLLGRVIVVEDDEAAQRMIRRGLGAVVTVDGTLIEPSGILSGGSTDAGDGIFARQRELEELPAQIEALREKTKVTAQQIETARESIEQLSRRAGETEGAYDALRRELEGVRADVDRERERLHRLRRELSAIHAKLADIDRERAESQRTMEQSRQIAERIDGRRAEQQEQVAAAEMALAEATRRREAALQAVSEASGRLASIEGERKTLELMREQHERALERIGSQISAKRLKARNLELEAAVIDERIEKYARELDAAREEQRRTAEDAAPDRDELHRLENHERAVQQEFEEAQSMLLSAQRLRLDLEAELERATERAAALRSEMEREGLGINARGDVVSMDEVDAEVLAAAAERADGPSIKGGAIIDLEQTRSEIEAIRRQIRRLGPINEEAPEDYHEVEERYTFLTGQVKDLTDAEAQLRQAIDELNEEIRVRFESTFRRVNEAFGEYFSAFFGGGNARILLTDPDDIAQSGVDIEAQPPGKRLNSLNLLSGGERALTAVALLFALLSVNPAPFCVLDEVDAALDEANVGRFTDALKKLSERTQFIIITHNRRTIEVADAIYGVSMGRDGVSKVLSLRLADLPQN